MFQLTESSLQLGQFKETSGFFTQTCERVHTVVRKAHLVIVTALAFSPNSRALASASLDSSARVTLIEDKKKSGRIDICLDCYTFHSTRNSCILWEAEGTSPLPMEVGVFTLKCKQTLSLYLLNIVWSDFRLQFGAVIHLRITCFVQTLVLHRTIPCNNVSLIYFCYQSFVFLNSRL